MNTVLGVDGGGSRTRAIVGDAGGRLIGSAIEPSVNPRHHDLRTVSGQVPVRGT